MISTNNLKSHESTHAQVQNTTATSGSSSSDQAASLSLMQLEELLNGLADTENNPAAEKSRKKAENSKEELLNDVVMLLTTALSKGLKSNPDGVKKMVALTASTLEQLTRTDPKATGFVVASMGIAINDFLEKNPEDHAKVVNAFSPLIALCGVGVVANLEKAASAIGGFQAAFSKEDPATAKPKLEALMQTLVGNGAGQTLSSLVDSIKGELNSLDASDGEKYNSLVRSLFDILSLVTLSNPKTAKEVSQTLLKDGFISSIYKLDKTQMNALLTSVINVMKEMTNPNSVKMDVVLADLHNAFANVTSPTAPPVSGCGGDLVGNINGFLNTYQNQREQNSPNLSTLLGMAMMFFQQFEQSVAQSQAVQDQATIAIGDQSVKSSMDLQKSLDSQIAQEEAEIAAANAPRPWYDYLIEAVVALVAVIVSAVTAGIGAAIAAGLVAAFMMSPLGAQVQGDLAQAIAGGSEQDLYNSYVSQGMSPSDAQAKASEEWNKAMGFAGLIMIVATVILTAGVGGIGGAADSAATNVVNDVADNAGNLAGDSLEEAGTDAAAQTTADSQSIMSKLASYSVSQGLKVGLAQGVSMTASLDPMLNFLMTDPAIANNSELTSILAGVLEVATALLAIGAGCWAASSAPQALSEMFSSSIMPLLIANGLIGAGSGGYEAYTDVQQGKYLKDAADVEGELGATERMNTLYSAIIQMNQQTETNINTADTSLINTITSMMTAVENMAGQPAAAANQVLAG
jgi:hypothetical protein